MHAPPSWQAPAWPDRGRSAMPTAPTAEDRFLTYARSRDPELLDALLREWADRAYTHARRMLGRHELAEDAVQEAYVRLIATADRYRPEVPFAAWLGRLIHVACAEQRRKRARHHRALGKVRAMPPTPEPVEADDSLREPMRAALAELPETYRAPLALHYFAGLDQAAVAQALGLKPGALRVRLSRGLERLRQRLGRAGVACSAMALGDALASQPSFVAPASLH